MLKVFLNDDPQQGRYYTVEFRDKDGWDRGIQRDTVLIHEVRNHTSYLVDNNGGPGWLAGQTFTDLPNSVPIQVAGIDSASSTAAVQVVRVPPIGAVVSAVSAVPGGVSLFTIDKSAVVQGTYYDPRVSTAWAPWFGLPGRTLPTGAAVTAVSTAPGEVSLFAVDGSGVVQSAYYDPNVSNTWASWFVLPGPTFATGTPVTAVSPIPGGVSLFGVDTNGVLQSTYFDPRISNTWAPRPVLSDPTFST
jgi:hypothetical protein